MAILETHDLVRRFGGLVALKGVSLAVEPGEIFGVIGPNGAGKSVLMHCIAGALRPNAGRIVLGGTDTTGAPPEDVCRLGLSRTFQIPQPFPKLTVLENVLTAARFGTRDLNEDPLAVAREQLGFVEFSHGEEILASTLNAVDLKRLDLARALASRPRVLLLDELAAGLVTGQLNALMDILRRIREQGVTIVMVEHVMRTILGLCDRVAVLQHGEKIAEGRPLEVASEAHVVEAYLGARFAS